MSSDFMLICGNQCPERHYCNMAANRRWKLTAREARMLVYLLLLLGVVAWKFVPRPWHPSLKIETSHHAIYSSATRSDTEATAHALELLYNVYSNRFGVLPTFRPTHPTLQVKLFRDRTEFRRVNPGLGWAEAFYREPYCRAYYSAGESNPFHWMLHEAVHQLNNEVAHLDLAKWLEEGLAEYFSTSRLAPTELRLGRIDPDTYPVWWIDEIATRPALAENIRNGSVIPLRSIISNSGGPGMRRHFNLYYLHWWTLTYFIFESSRYSEHALDLAKRGGGLAAFEQTIGPLDQVQIEWHDYVRQLKAALSGSDVTFHKTGKLSQGTNAPALR
jgi:hypothetical protein